MAAPTVILIRGGLVDGDPTRATAGTHRWGRGDAEPFEAFEARATAGTTAAGERFPILGGLPDR